MAGRRRERGVSYFELVATAAILAILAAAILPLAKVTRTRQKELDLRRALREIRVAIDRHEKDVERGLIQGEHGNEGFPADLEALVKGVPMVGRAGTVKRKYLRRIPVDPMTGNTEWGMRCYEDEPDGQSWCGKNVYDVYTKHQGKGLDDTEYRTW